MKNEDTGTRVGYGKAKIVVNEGNIITHPAQAIMIPIDTGNLWLAGIHQNVQLAGVNGALQEDSGSWYYWHATQQVLEANNKPMLYDGQAIVVSGDGCEHAGNFSQVVFVVDNLFYADMATIITAGLTAAHDAGISSISLPLMRSGVMTTVSHFSITELTGDTARGIWKAIELFPEWDITINVLFLRQMALRGIRSMTDALIPFWGAHTLGK